MIKTLADVKLDDVELETSLRIFKNRTLFFFRIIFYSNILSFLLLKTSLDIIYTFLFSLNDRRVINLFKFTTFALKVLAQKKIVKDKNLTLIAITASLIILKRIMKLN